MHQNAVVSVNFTAAMSISRKLTNNLLSNSKKRLSAYKRLMLTFRWKVADVLGLVMAPFSEMSSGALNTNDVGSPSELGCVYNRAPVVA